MLTREKHSKRERKVGKTDEEFYSSKYENEKNKTEIKIINFMFNRIQKIVIISIEKITIGELVINRE